MKYIIIPTLFFIFNLSAEEITFGNPKNDYYEAGIHLFGFSHHYKDKENINNENNWGIGGQFNYFVRQNTNWYVGPQISIGTYKDSMSHQATYVLGGFSTLYGNPQKWHTYFNLGFGYYNGSGFDGFGSIVSIGGGYKWFNIEGIKTSEFAAIWAKIRVWYN